LALMLIAGCSTYDSLVGAKPPPATPSSSAAAPLASPSFTDRFKNFVAGGSSTTAAAGASPGIDSVNTDIDCPSVTVSQGASTYQLSAQDNGSAALSLRYQASFVRFARECAVRGGNVTLKVGVEGRIILGPAGTPGTVTLPVRLAVVKEGLEPKTIWTKFYAVPVIVPAGQPYVMFTHVEEDMTFPKPPGNELDKYVIYTGFDPDSLAAEQKKAPKPKRKTKG
jgi:hypothetical protein